MKSVNQIGVRTCIMFNRPMKMRSHYNVCAALVKESRSYFQSPNYKENTGNNKEFVSSESSQLEEDDHQKLEADSVPENTKTTAS